MSNSEIGIVTATPEIFAASGVVSMEVVVGAEVGDVWMLTSEAMISRSKSASMLTTEVIISATNGLG